MVDALRTAPDDVESILSSAAAAMGAHAVCVLRPRNGRLVADAVYGVDDSWAYRTMVICPPGAAGFDEIDPVDAVAFGAGALSVPETDWTCARSISGSLILGVAGGAFQAAAGALATALDIVTVRDATSAASRLTALQHERARIASVVHEGVSQELSTVAIQLEVLTQLVGDTPQVRELAALTRATTRRAIATIREAILDLTPILPNAGSLSAGVRQLVDDFANRWALDISCDVDGREVDIDADAVGLVYAFVQEALTNLRKHSHEHTAALRLTFDDTAIGVTVRSVADGAGDIRTESTGQGLSVMRGRARLLGGDVISSMDVDGGRVVMLRIPI
jgi:signal transduction histidine kinase